MPVEIVGGPFDGHWMQNADPAQVDEFFWTGVSPDGRRHIYRFDGEAWRYEGVEAVRTK